MLQLFFVCVSVFRCLHVKFSLDSNHEAQFANVLRGPSVSIMTRAEMSWPFIELVLTEICFQLSKKTEAQNTDVLELQPH